MRDFLTIYERLEELLLNKFPEYITEFFYEKDDIPAYKKTIC